MITTLEPGISHDPLIRVSDASYSQWVRDLDLPWPNFRSDAQWYWADGEPNWKRDLLRVYQQRIVKSRHGANAVRLYGYIPFSAFSGFDAWYQKGGVWEDKKSTRQIAFIDMPRYVEWYRTAPPHHMFELEPDLPLIFKEEETDPETIDRHGEMVRLRQERNGEQVIEFGMPKRFLQELRSRRE